MATTFWMVLLRWDPTEAADPPRTFEDVGGLLHKHLGGDIEASDNAWTFSSQRGWLTDVLHDLCHVTGADCPEALWGFDPDPIVLTAPDLRRTAGALDKIIARLGDRETTVVLNGGPAGLERLDRTLLARLQPVREISWADGTDHPAEAAGTFLLSLRDAVGDALRQRCWLIGINSS